MAERCPVCDSTAAEAQGDYRAAHPTFAGLKRAHCSACGMGFATPMPSDAALDEYNARYFAAAHGGLPTNAVASAFFSGIARLRVAHLDRYVAGQGIPVSSVIEFGPGPGFFAGGWLERRPATNYMAVETDLSCHELLRRKGVKLVAATAQANGGAPVDAMVMSHVLEHVPDPVKFITEATRCLRGGGALFIEVPCLDYQHKALDEPHLLFFDKQPLLHLLRRLGFENIEVSYHGEEIDRLRSAPRWRSRWIALRSKLIGLGWVAPFARSRSGMESLRDPLERAAVAPFKAHRESQRPAWWLRAVARKGQISSVS